MRFTKKRNGIKSSLYLIHQIYSKQLQYVQTHLPVLADRDRGRERGVTAASVVGPVAGSGFDSGSFPAELACSSRYQSFLPPSIPTWSNERGAQMNNRKCWHIKSKSI